MTRNQSAVYTPTPFYTPVPHPVHKRSYTVSQKMHQLWNHIDRGFWIFLPHDITTDPKNFQPYRFKVGAFFQRHGVYFTPVHTPVYSTHLSQSFHVHTPVYSTHLSESFHVHLGTAQLLPRMMSVTATLCHATKLARQVKHVDDQRTPTDLVLQYLTTQQHQNCTSRVE